MTAPQRKLGMPQDRLREMTLMDFMPLVPEEDLRAFLAPLVDGKKQEIVFETVLGTSPRLHIRPRSACSI